MTAVGQGKNSIWQYRVNASNDRDLETQRCAERTFSHRLWVFCGQCMNIDTWGISWVKECVAQIHSQAGDRSHLGCFEADWSKPKPTHKKSRRHYNGREVCFANYTRKSKGWSEKSLANPRDKKYFFDSVWRSREHQRLSSWRYSVGRALNAVVCHRGRITFEIWNNFLWRGIQRQDPWIEDSGRASSKQGKSRGLSRVAKGKFC